MRGHLRGNGGIENRRGALGLESGFGYNSESPSTMRKGPVDLMFLPMAFEHHIDGEWYLDLETGDVLSTFDDPETEMRIEDDEEERYLLITPPVTHDDFRVMEDFVAGLPAGEAKRDLERVLRRAKPFHNFREALRDWPTVQTQWFAQRDQRIQEQMHDWLVAHEIEPIPRPPRGATVTPHPSEPGPT